MSVPALADGKTQWGAAETAAEHAGTWMPATLPCEAGSPCASCGTSAAVPTKGAPEGPATPGQGGPRRDSSQEGRWESRLPEGFAAQVVTLHLPRPWSPLHSGVSLRPRPALAGWSQSLRRVKESLALWTVTFWVSRCHLDCVMSSLGDKFTAQSLRQPVFIKFQVCKCCARGRGATSTGQEKEAVSPC